MKYSVSTEQAIAQLAHSIVRHHAEFDQNPPSTEEIVESIQRRIRSDVEREVAKVSKAKQVENEPTVTVDSGKAADSSDVGNAPTIDSPNSDDLDLTASSDADRGVAFPPGPSNRPAAPAEYQILGVLGKGGMGIVYKAWHAPLRRVVAVKMILAGAHASPRALARFQQEAEAAARLSHPNIVAVFEVGHHESLPFFSLEYVAGESMSAMLRDSVLSSDKACELMRKVARAVHYSHQQGIIHRDLKPQNIMISEQGEPKVTDFGLAKLLWDEGQEETKTGEILGTPGYISPEQARGERSVGPPADIHALGAILYFLLTGRAPFVGTTPVDTIRQVISDEPLPPSKLQPKLNVDLETICLKCLQKEPEKRYQTAEELAAELDRVVAGEPILARRVTRVERLGKWCRRNPRIATLSGIAAALLLILLLGGYASAGIINQQRIAEATAREQAEEKEVLANQQADLALDISRLVLYQTQEFFSYRPNINQLRDQMLNGILEKIEELYASREDYDVKQTFRASAIRQLGVLYYEAGRFNQAMEHLLESERIAKQLDSEGRLSRPLLNYSNLDMWIGDTHKRLREFEQAQQRYRSLVDRRQAYFEAEPQIDPMIAEQSMAEAYGKLGDLLRTQRRFDEAQPLLERAVNSRRKWFDTYPSDLRTGEELAGSLGNLCNLYEQTDQPEKMLAAGDEALRLLRRSAIDKSDFPTITNLGIALKRSGRQYQLVGKTDQALQLLLEASSQLDLALAQSPDFDVAQKQAIDTYFQLAKLQFYSGQDNQATCDRGIEISEVVISKSRVVDNHFLKLRLLAIAGRVDEADDLAGRIAGDQSNIHRCLLATIGYGLASEHCQGDRKSEMLDKAVQCINSVVSNPNFSDISMLRTDPDFAPLQEYKPFRDTLDAADQSSQ